MNNSAICIDTAGHVDNVYSLVRWNGTYSGCSLSKMPIRMDRKELNHIIANTRGWALKVKPIYTENI
jgi:hypothetical protein